MPKALSHGQKRSLSDFGERMRRLAGMAREMGVKDPQDVRDAKKSAAKLQFRVGGRFAKKGPEGWQDRIEAVSDELQLTTAWISVSSSNVDAVRWVGGSHGLNVRFKGGWLYFYQVPYSTFRAMVESTSKGKFIWMLRNTGVPYKREKPATIPPKIIYPFGSIGRSSGAVRTPAVPGYVPDWAK